MNATFAFGQISNLLKVFISLQRLTEFPLAQGSRQFPFPQDTADPPDLQTTEGMGNQT